ncbi:MAG: DUF2383 domain-containing protein [Bdellovibrionales bacterium]|nr:DUF2383 domain-containing protein [Bdellovibrionales bacterium]
MDTEKQTIEACNTLLRGELSAVETFQQAIQKFDGEKDGENESIKTLERLLADHQESADLLKEKVKALGAVPTESSGMWGVVAQTAAGTGKMFGKTAAVLVLKAGEKKGRADYEKVLHDKDVAPECKELIRRTLLPRQMSHIATLQRLKDLIGQPIE